MGLYRDLQEAQRTLVGGEILLASLERMPGASKGGSIVSLRVCVDASTTKTYVGGKPAEDGGSGSDILYFGRFEGVLKIQGADGKAVESC